MPHKCIYSHTYEEFMIWSHIQVYKGDANIYGPLWTLTCICTMWTYFLTIIYIFPFLFFPQKTLSLPISSTITWQTFSITAVSYISSPPYILLIAPHSPVICKDYFSLVYMYKLSRYYAIFHINLGSIFPWCYAVILGANDRVAKSVGGDVRGTWLQLMCCTLPKMSVSLICLGGSEWKMSEAVGVGLEVSY